MLVFLVVNSINHVILPQCFIAYGLQRGKDEVRLSGWLNGPAKVKPDMYMSKNLLFLIAYVFVR